MLGRTVTRKGIPGRRISMNEDKIMEKNDLYLKNTEGHNLAITWDTYMVEVAEIGKSELKPYCRS